MIYIAVAAVILLLIGAIVYVVLKATGELDGLFGDRRAVIVTRSIRGGYFKVWTDLTPEEISEIEGVVHVEPDAHDRTGAVRVDLDRRYGGAHLRRELNRLSQNDEMPDVWSDAVDDALGQDK